MFHKSRILLGYSSKKHFSQKIFIIALIHRIDSSAMRVIFLLFLFYNFSKPLVFLESLWDRSVSGLIRSAPLSLCSLLSMIMAEYNNPFVYLLKEH